MATYEYQNHLGEKKEISLPMNGPHPESILIFEDGSWQDATRPIVGRARLEELQSKPWRDAMYERVYGSGVELHTIDLACRPGKDGLPISHAASRRSGGKVSKRGEHMVREHADGITTNMVGQPIIDSNNTAREYAKKTGMEID